MTLSCSKHGYEEPLWTQERDGFLRAHEHAFVRLRGVPKVIRHDNLKAAVVRACLYDPDVSEVYAAFAQHWGFVPLPSRPRHPQENGVAERSGGYVKSNALKGRRFDSLAGAGRVSRALEPHRGPGAHPRHHASAGAAPLPRGRATAAAAAAQRAVRVVSDRHPHACIPMDTSRLTAPSTRCRTRWSASRCARSGMATWCASTASAADGERQARRGPPARAARHATPPSPSTDRCIDQHVKRRTKPSCSARPNTSVPQALAWAQAVIDERGVRAYRLLQGLISLTRSHPRERVDWACGYTLQYRLFRYRTLRRLLEQAADRGASAQAAAGARRHSRPARVRPDSPEHACRSMKDTSPTMTTTTDQLHRR